jgi:hypothetical protein
MTWFYKNQLVIALPQDCVGFVYVITNLQNNRRYIGKKLAKFAKTRYKTITQKNGKKVKRKIRSHIDSDWQTYWGSSKELSADVERLSTQAFRREILHFCESKSLCSYLEAKEQFQRGVLESDAWYNGHIQVRVHGSHILCKV